MLMWSARYLGQKKIHTDCVTIDEAQARQDARVVESITNLMNESDIVMAHNGDGFDIPWIRGRGWVNGTEPLAPVVSIDTKTRAARDFKLTHNNLDVLARLKGYRQKDKTDFSWWSEILAGNEKMLRKMHRYNRKDVNILHDVYESMIPYLTRLPRLVDGQGMVCPWCGSTDLQKRGKKRTNAFTYQRWRCNGCGRYPSERSHDKSNVTGLRPT